MAELLGAERRHLGPVRTVECSVAGSKRYSSWPGSVTGSVRSKDIALLGAGFGLSRVTSYRYHAEGVRVLAVQSPDLNEALNRVIEEGWAYVILDGTIVPTDRDHAPTISVKDTSIDLWYSGKAHDHGGNLRGLMRARRPLRRSPPGTAHPGRNWQTRSPAAALCPG